MVVRIRARQMQRNLRNRPDPSAPVHRASNSYFLVHSREHRGVFFQTFEPGVRSMSAFSWQLGHASWLDERNHSSRHALQNTCLFAHNVTTGDSAKSAHILHVNSSTLSESTRLNGNPDPPLPPLLAPPPSVSMTTTTTTTTTRARDGVM